MKYFPELRLSNIKLTHPQINAYDQDIYEIAMKKLFQFLHQEGKTLLLDKDHKKKLSKM